MLTSVATTCPLLITILLITTVKTTILSYLDYCYDLLTWLSIPTLVYLGLSLGFPYQSLPGSFSSRHTAFLSLLAAHQTSSPHRALVLFPHSLCNFFPQICICSCPYFLSISTQRTLPFSKRLFLTILQK